MTQEIMDMFVHHGNEASYFFADDSGGDWSLGFMEQSLALELFDEHPELQDQMREVAKGFLWSLSLVRPK